MGMTSSQVDTAPCTCTYAHAPMHIGIGMHAYDILSGQYGSRNSEYTFNERDVRPYGVMLLNPLSALCLPSTYPLPALCLPSTCPLSALYLPSTCSLSALCLAYHDGGSNPRLPELSHPSSLLPPLARPELESL